MRISDAFRLVITSRKVLTPSLFDSMRASSLATSSRDVGRANGLKDVVLLEHLDELEDVPANHFLADLELAADFVCDARLVVALREQIKDLGSDEVQAEHLAMMNVQKDAAVHGLGSPDCLGDLEHCCEAAGGSWVPRAQVNVASNSKGFPETASPVRREESSGATQLKRKGWAVVIR